MRRAGMFMLVLAGWLWWVGGVSVRRGGAGRQGQEHLLFFDGLKFACPPSDVTSADASARTAPRTLAATLSRT